MNAILYILTYSLLQTGYDFYKQIQKLFRSRKAVLRIRIHRFRIRIQLFSWIGMVPIQIRIQVFDEPNLQLKFLFYFCDQ
jgi:hypothetical protein